MSSSSNLNSYHPLGHKLLSIIKKKCAQLSNTMELGSYAVLYVPLKYLGICCCSKNDTQFVQLLVCFREHPLSFTQDQHFSTFAIRQRKGQNSFRLPGNISLMCLENNKSWGQGMLWWLHGQVTLPCRLPRQGLLKGGDREGAGCSRENGFLGDDFRFCEWGIF